MAATPERDLCGPVVRTQTARLGLALLSERAKGQSSAYAPYVSSLPAAFQARPSVPRTRSIKGSCAAGPRPGSPSPRRCFPPPGRPHVLQREGHRGDRLPASGFSSEEALQVRGCRSAWLQVRTSSASPQVVCPAAAVLTVASHVITQVPRRLLEGPDRAGAGGGPFPVRGATGGRQQPRLGPGCGAEARARTRRAAS